MSDERSTAAPAALELDAVTFAYGPTAGPVARRAEPIANGVSLVVPRGEMVALLGPNGAGKTSLLRLASGVLRPHAGRVLIDGRDVRRMTAEELARRVAMMPQDFNVQFTYTVRQIVELGRTPYLGTWGTLRARDRLAVNEALAEAGLEALADRVFEDLSGGERQRTLVALALAQQAPMLLMDEPTAHLDIRHQIETLELLWRLHQERGLTVLATMHDLNLAARYFPRLIVYKRQVVADGPPTEALDEATLSAVYETPVRVGILRGDERLSIHPPAQGVTEPEPETQPRPLQAHVIAGGGSGELLMRALADAGVSFSAGPLNVGDSDGALAQRLAALTLIEPPHAPISAEGLAAARERMIEAGAVVICPAPLGPGNIALLDAASEALRAGARVILLESGLGGSIAASEAPRSLSAPTAPAATDDDADETSEMMEGDTSDALACDPDPAETAMEPASAPVAARPAHDATPVTDAAGLALVAARDFSGRGRAAYAALLAGGAIWATSPTAALHAALKAPA